MKGAPLFLLLSSIAIVAVCCCWNSGAMAGVALSGQLLVMSVSLNVHYYRRSKGVARIDNGWGRACPGIYTPLELTLGLDDGG